MKRKAIIGVLYRYVEFESSVLSVVFDRSALWVRCAAALFEHSACFTGGLSLLALQCSRLPP
jgi:hypothetical protein